MYIYIYIYTFARLTFSNPVFKKKRKKIVGGGRKLKRREKARECPSMTTLRQLSRGGAPLPPFVSETCRDKRRLCRKAASRSNCGRTIPVIEFNCSTKEESYLIAPPLCTRRFTINPRRNIRNAINWIVNRFVSPLVPPVVLYPF